MENIPHNIFTHTETLWTDLKAKLETNCNDDTPFMLLPIRLETRFMTINRKIFDIEIGEWIKDIEISIGETKELANTYSGFPFEKEIQVVSAFDEVIGSIQKDTSKLTEVRSLLLEENIFLLDAVSKLETSTNALASYTTRLAKSDEQIALYLSKNNQVSSAINTLKQVINENSPDDLENGEESRNLDKEIHTEIGEFVLERNKSLKQILNLSDAIAKLSFEKDAEVSAALGEVLEAIINENKILSEVKSLLIEENIYLLETVSKLEINNESFVSTIAENVRDENQLKQYTLKNDEISGALGQLKQIIVEKTVENNQSKETENVESKSFSINNIYHYEEKKELWVRIYPDDIHVETHEKLLTNDEEIAGIEYWNLWWTSDGDRNTHLGAWRALCELFGPQRAAWIIKQTEPINLPSTPEHVYIDPTDSITDVGVWAQYINENDLNIYQIEHNGNVLAEQLDRALIKTEYAILEESHFEGFRDLLTDSQNALNAFNTTTTNYDRAEILFGREDNIEQNPSSHLSTIVKSLKELKSKESEVQVGEILETVQQSIEELKSINEELNGSRLSSEMLSLNTRLVARIEEEVSYAIVLVNAAVSTEENLEGNDFSLFKTKISGQEDSLIEVFTQTENEASTLKRHISERRDELRILDYRDNQEMILETHSTILEKFNTLNDWLLNQEPQANWNIFDHLPENPSFPVLVKKNLSWTQAAKTETLPDRFVALGLNCSTSEGEETYDFKQLEVGNLVPSSLIMGPNPAAIDEVFSHQVSGDLVVGEEMKWMFNFDEALKKGMGIIMELPGDGYVEGQEENIFDKLIVIGLKVEKDRFVQPDASKDYSTISLKEHSKELLEKMLENHHFTGDGMSLLKIGTPTNNTDSEDSGFNFDENSYEDSFEFETKNKLFPIVDSDYNLSDGQRLCDTLGIDYNLFQHIQNADNKGISNAKITNSILWSGTMGNHLKELFSGLFTRDTILNAEDFFTKHVTARGAVPSLRIGNQPYGILPTTSYSRWKFGYENPNNELDSLNGLSKNRFHVRLKYFFDIMMKEWLKLADEHVLYTGKSSINVQKDFTEMLGLHATSSEYYARHAFNIGESYLADYAVAEADSIDGEVEIPEVSFDGGILSADFPGSLFEPLLNSGIYPNYLSRFEDTAHITRLMYTTEKLKLFGASVDKNKLSENNPIGNPSTNYINWIKHSKLTDIWNHNNFNTDTSILPSRSLLFYLLRQSYLFSYLDSFIEMMSVPLQKQFSHFSLNNLHDYKPSGYSSSIPSNGVQPPPYLYTHIGKWYYFFNNVADIDSNTPEFNEFNEILNENINYYTGITNSNFNANTIWAEEFKKPNSLIWDFNKGLENKNKLDNLNILLNKLRYVPSKNLERLMQEHLDLCSYRLDAWVNGLVHERIEEQRLIEPTRKKGIYLGSYGWLNNVKPGSTRTIIAPEDIPETLRSNNVHIDEDNLGFIHAPSMGHALTAAILRSGYISNQDENSLDKKMSINLSSERVRMATKLLDGVRSGQSVGALLGYQFERGLHERYTSLNLDSFIYKFRKKFPINNEITPSTGIAENLIAQNVVNGVDLLSAVKSILTVGGTIVEGDTLFEKIDANYSLLQSNLLDVDNTAILPATKDAEAIAIIREIDLLANAIDALADLAIAEGVFQVTRGNYTRASSVIESITNGQQLEEPEIINTPRTGNNVTHKIMLNMEKIPLANIASDKPWTTSLTPRAKAEPSYNKWLSTYLPAPHLIKCIVTFENESAIAVTEIITLENLDIQPIDFVYLMSSDVDTGGSELLGRIAYYLRGNSTLFHTNGDIGISYETVLDIQLSKRDSSWTTDTYSFFELTSITRELNFILINCKPIQAQDFIISEKATTEGTNPHGIDINDLQSRVTQLRDDLEILLTSIENLSTPNLSDLRLKLLACSSYGIINTIPEYVVDIDSGSSTEINDKLTKQLEVAFNELNDKRTEMNNILSTISGLSIFEQKKKLLECSTILFGKSFKMSVHFSLASNVLTEVKEHIIVNNPLLMGNHDDENLETWQYSLARVRKKITAFETISNLSDEFSLLTPIQIPYKESDDGKHDYWYGLEFPEEYMPTGHKTSIVFTNASIITSSNPSESITGIILDEWLETIPNKEETSGLTFNYDQPNSKPPQNILLAITPEITGNWKWDDLIFTLLETQKMTKIRAVEPDHISKNKLFGHLIPSIMAMTKVPVSSEDDNGSGYNSFPDEWKEFNVTFPYEENIKPN